jgi:hypothetical protein
MMDAAARPAARRLPSELMRTRTIVTSQPDVACYVCERRLLRGEQPEIFIADARPRTVCELCAPRAANQGWLREADGDSVSLPPVRARRGRNLFGRLLQLGRGASASATVAPTSASYDREPERYDFLGGAGALDAGTVGARAEDRSAAAPPHSGEAAMQGSQSHSPPMGIMATAEDGPLQRALEVFNAGEYPRRVAGLARSLGVPGVNIRLLEDSASVVAIVLAWELCWYRYVVDLDDDAPDARVLAQGSELGELAPEDRLANAVVDELGALSLTGAQP